MAPHCSLNEAHTPSCGTDAPSGLTSASTQPPSLDLPPFSCPHAYVFCCSSAPTLGPLRLCSHPMAYPSPICFLVNSYSVLRAASSRKPSLTRLLPGGPHPAQPSVILQESCCLWSELWPTLGGGCQARRGAVLDSSLSPSLQPTAVQGCAACSLNERQGRRIDALKL